MLYRLQLLKIQRLHGITPEPWLVELDHSEQFIGELSIPALYKLYKENHYQGNRVNVEIIQRLVSKFDSKLLQNKFFVFDLK